jgi:hypothetical protein
MSRRVGDITIIEEEPERRCEFCGKLDECRPYGPHDEQICFECAMKDPETTERQMRKHLYGEHSA